MKELGNPIDIHRQGDLEYASAFLSPSHVGGYVGEGARARVYRLLPGFSMDTVEAKVHDPRIAAGLGPSGETEAYVIKIPKTESVIAPSSATRKLLHFSTAVQTFNKFITTPTYVLSTPSRASYCIVQRFIPRSEPVTLQNMKGVANDLSEFFDTHVEFVRKGMCMEVLGKDGLVKCMRAYAKLAAVPELSNIVIESRSGVPSISIPDVTVIFFGRQYHEESMEGRMRQNLRFIGYRIQKKILADFFGYDIG